ncbi:MAG: alpha/beta fold hydrolase [Candidatus Obscuribacter sp.]|jgi:acylglycerol lipase|nr:alpha/beta fold hydrolase [Candidatus Obscuribacter sp.]MBK9774373.1 alpha/beta fold hydrolase [Candidatus Obscuribacter sp.]MDQ5967098.1 Alpha/beta fold hydrolase [Cyanobacteriota bacterium erpe_2018_sw_39hr_WHONDRS-SW48-000098_B_bin.30]
MSLSSSSFGKKLAIGGNSLHKSFKTILTGIAALGLTLAVSAPVSAEVERLDEPRLVGHDYLPELPVSVWQDQEKPAKGVVVAVHGLVMHGRVYDVMARKLAAQGFIVLAPDLRGYGRWQTDVQDESKAGKEDGKVQYHKSLEDLKGLVAAVSVKYPNLPLFLVGESLGAGLSIRVAEALPESVSGLVLSSPAIKRRMYLEPEMVVQAASLVTNPMRQVDLVPYIKKFASEDPRIVEEAINDPYVRKHLNLSELMGTASIIRGNISHAHGVPASVPVLVIQGDKDKMLRSDAVTLLLSRLRTKDRTVRWLPGKGHVLIETAHIEPSTMSTISSWLDDHLMTPTRETYTEGLVSSGPGRTLDVYQP